MAANDAAPPSQPAGTTIESTLAFTPKFASDGLLPAIVTDAKSGSVLMFAHMNADALERTIATGLAHFWSRSRAKPWLKGEDSGNSLRIIEMRTDCDQDVIWLAVDVEGAGVACHTGERSCFYRRVVRAGEGGTVLEFAAMPREET